MKIHVHNRKASRGAGPEDSSHLNTNDADPIAVNQAGIATRPPIFFSCFRREFQVLAIWYETCLCPHAEEKRHKGRLREKIIPGGGVEAIADGMVNIRSEMDERMEINILDYRLKVMTIGKSAISKFTHSLLDVIFLKHYMDNNNYKEHHGFVSVTESEDEYSIIIEEEAFNSFNIDSKHLVVNKETWLPLVASAGPMLTENTTAGISKIANSVLIPLADQGISVYPLSTYRTDYVLIQESDFNKACEVLAQNFRITREGILDSLEIIVEPSKIKKVSWKAANNTRPITHSFDCNNSRTYCITSMDSESLRSQALVIMDMLFYSDTKKASTANHGQQNQGCFFNLSIINQDISLVFDIALLPRFPPKVLFNNGEYWHIIRIDMPDGVGFREAGIVAQISEPIASAHISEYYISSFTRGHALVPVEHFEEVRKILEKKRDQYQTPEAHLQIAAA